MSDTSAPRQSLGVGALFGEAVRLFFGRLPLFLAVAVLPAFALSALQLFAVPVMSDPMAALNPLGVLTSPAFLASMVVVGASVTMIVAVTTLAAYDVKLGKPAQISQYLRRSMRSLVPIIVLGIIFYIVFIIGLALLVVPGLYVAACFAVMTPAIVIEGAGFGGMRRAAQLSKGYRWPIAGLLLLVLIVFVIINLLVTLPVTGFSGLIDDGIPDEGTFFLLNMLDAAVAAFQYAFFAILAALLYARLRALKEGLGFEDLANVFE